MFSTVINSTGNLNSLKLGKHTCSTHTTPAQKGLRSRNWAGSNNWWWACCSLQQQLRNIISHTDHIHTLQSQSHRDRAKPQRPGSGRKADLHNRKSLQHQHQWRVIFWVTSTVEILTKQMLTLLQVKSGFLKFTDSFGSKWKHPRSQLGKIQHNVSHKKGKNAKKKPSL